MVHLSSQWTLKKLVRGLEIKAIRGERVIPISGVAIDSRRVLPGNIFFALKGEQYDGNLFVEDAVRRGAVAIASERSFKHLGQVTTLEIPQIRKTLAQLVRRFYGEPDKKLQVVAITGTNGKTTVSKMLQYLLQTSGHKPGYLGTVGYDLGKRSIKGMCTTPSVVDLYQYLAEMVEAGCTHAILEATSHGIHQRRLFELEVEVAAFLNLTQDHLDYHGTMEDYFQAKAALFNGENGPIPKHSIINVDDGYGAKLAESLQGTLPITTCGEQASAAIRAYAIQSGKEGSQFSVQLGKQAHLIRLPLLGRFNVNNVLAAFSIGQVLGLDGTKMSEHLKCFPGVPGRMEAIKPGLPFQVIVDFAHTPEALAHTLGALSEVVVGRLLVVFGCGGQRDQAKRPLMMASVQEYASFTWATADNPRKEPLESIFEGMRAGVSKPDSVVFIEDRRVAIRKAIQEAKEGDCVVIAGRGHEAFQQLAHSTIPFEDRRVALEEIQHLAMEVCA